MSHSSWYALTVKPRHEHAASQHLRAKDLEPFLPTYRALRQWSDRRKELDLCLFPGYVFCRFSYEERLQVLGTPGITSIVGFARKPAPVPDSEIDAIQTMVKSGRAFEPWPYLRAGDRVRIEEGCLRGLSGALIREKDRWRVVVNIELLQRSVAVEVDREALTPIHDSRIPLHQPVSLLKAG